MRDLSQVNNVKKGRWINNFRVNASLVTLIAILGLAYIFSVNSIATAGFKIKKMSTDLANLQSQNQKLQLQNSTLQSVTYIQQETASLNLVPTTDITYLKDDNFALK
jgi:hypothetical protein